MIYTSYYDYVQGVPLRTYNNIAIAHYDTGWDSEDERILILFSTHREVFTFWLNSHVFGKKV